VPWILTSLRSSPPSPWCCHRQGGKFYYY
jgi:hypothetical protein